MTEWYDLQIDTMELKEDPVHLFLTEPPQHSPSDIARVRKKASAKVVFIEFSEVKAQLWSGELWSDGYLVRSFGDKVTSDVIFCFILSSLFYTRQK